MIYQKALNFLRGSVLLTVEYHMPERVFNLCAAHEIPFWDVHWQSDTRFSLRTTRWGWFRLRNVTKELGVTMELRREKGAPVVLRRFRRRYVLLGAAVVFGILMWCGSTFIWAFEVTGNDTVPTERILRALEAQGVCVGSRSMEIDQEELRNHVLLELKEISWLAVNVSGCTAHVQVVERHRPPELMKDSNKCNVVAAKPGLVTKVEALDGKAQVMAGSTVTKGQLLISGVVDSTMTGVRLLHGMGRVYARTWYDLSVSVPLETQQYTAAEHTRTRIGLDFGKRRINFLGKGSVLGESCDKITTIHQMTLPFGFRLPITLVVEQTIIHEGEVTSRTIEEARQEGEQALLHQLQTLLCEDGTVESTRFSAAERDGYLMVTLCAECYEQIGQSVPIG